MASSFDDTSNSEKSLKFKDDLMKFFTEQRKENPKWPVVSGKNLDLYKLFCEVMKRGGYENVNKTRQWKEVVSTLNLPPTCTSATFTISLHYKKCLLSYEKYICSGGTTQHISSSTTSSSAIHPSLRSPYQQGHYMTHQQMNNTSSSSLTKQTQYLNQPTRNEEEKYLGKKVLRTDPELNFFFRNPITKPTALKTKSNFKKINLWNAILDTKRVELAFESHLTSEIYWAINNLLLFSAHLNTSNTVGMGGVILIESQPYLMESMTNYIYYCVNNINSLYFIIDIIQGKQVDEHERLKEKLNWMFYKRNINTISSQGSSTSLYSKESKRINNSNNNVNNSNNSSNNVHSSSVNMHAAVTRSRGSVINNNNNTMINAQSQLSNNTTTLNAINVKPNMYYINTNNYNYNKGDFTFLDITNHTSSLPFLSKRNKDLKEIDQVKTLTSLTDDNNSNDVNTKQEEITEHELYEILISLIQIIRNLSFIAANEGSIFKSTKFMHMLYLLFIHSNLTEIVLNSLDIITNLSKNIILKDCQYAPLLMEKLYKCLISSNRELSEQALECFKRLVLTNGNEEYFEKMPDEFIYEIVNLLISPKNDIRDSALEILYCLSDQKISTKTRLGETDKLIQRLVALICTNSNDNRISKFAACVLSKLAEIPNILTLIMPYEQELFLAAATDESLTKMLLGIISN